MSIKWAEWRFGVTGEKRDYSDAIHDGVGGPQAAQETLELRMGWAGDGRSM